MRISPTQWLFLIALSILWGGSFLFVGIAIADLPPLTIVLARVAIAALLLLPLLPANGLTVPRAAAEWRPFLVMAILNNVIPFTLIATAQREVTSGLASVLNATTPLFTLLITHAFSGEEKLRANQLAGVLVGILGIAVLTGPEAIFGRTSSLLGMALCIAACLSYGFAAHWGRRLRATPPLLSAFCQLVCSTVVLAILAGAIDRPWLLQTPSPRTAVAILGLAALSTSLAYVIFFHILSVSGASNVMMVTLLIPVSGILFGVHFLDEPLVARHAAGALVIGCGLLLVDGRLALPGTCRRIRAPRKPLRTPHDPD